MRKRIYRVVSVKSVNREKLAEFVKGHRVVFGVDVAKEDFVGAFMNEGREVVQTIKWTSPGEVADIVALLKDLPSSTLEVAMEPSGTYGDTLRAFLQKEGFSVYLVSPKKTFDTQEDIRHLRGIRRRAQLSRRQVRGDHCQASFGRRQQGMA
jgi:transposase